MPQVFDNQDGTKTFAVNSSELRVLRNLLHARIPGFKKALDAVDGPQLREALKFVRSAVS